ncbi:hypothetical protein ABT097_28235 [Streptomyces sp. NPDC002225]|uniref:hypothetical protein n=1 Tax=Streptomyces sp. NPDC002225 TaxID=3154413 RepID=UPI00331C59E8
MSTAVRASAFNEPERPKKQQYLTLALRTDEGDVGFDVRVPCPFNPECSSVAWMPAYSVTCLHRALTGDLDHRDDIVCDVHGGYDDVDQEKQDELHLMHRRACRAVHRARPQPTWRRPRPRHDRRRPGLSRHPARRRLPPRPPTRLHRARLAALRDDVDPGLLAAGLRDAHPRRRRAALA